MTSTRHVRVALGALAPLCLAPFFACRDDATQVKVTIRTDLPCAQVRGRGTSITVGRADEDLGAKPAARVSFACDEQTRELGQPVFAPSGDDRDAAFAFQVVTAVSAESVDDCAASGYEGCIVAKRILRYVPQTTLYVDVSMDEACVGVVCDAAMTCSGGACVPALIEDPARCERIGACSDRPPSDAGAGGEGGGAGAAGAGGMGGTGGAGAGGEGGNAGGEGGSAGGAGGPTVTVSKFSTGYHHTCALAEGGLQCWGQQGLPEDPGPDGWVVNGRDFGSVPQPQSDVPSNTAFIATGWQHACAGPGDLGAGFALKCFGGNERRVLGNTSPGGASEPPTDIDGGGLWTQLAAGQVHACGIKGGDLLCWGSNDEGQRGIAPPLGDPDDEELSTISSTGDWAVLTAGAKHTCGIRKNSRLFCWGDNGRRQLGHDTDSPPALSVTLSDNFEVPMPSNGLWVKVSAGTAHTCAVFSDSSLLCWGRNDAGQANPTPSGDLPAPTDVRNNLDWGDVAAGELHTCGISSDRLHLYCWGDNALGQLGNATPAAPGGLTEVTDPEPGVAWDAVDAGGFHTCASKGSKLYCWGSNEFGQLGLGDAASAPVPTLVPFAAR